MVIQPTLLITLDMFREKLDTPLLINHGPLQRRGYRSPKENEAVGGEEFSFHMQGLAVDITAPQLDIETLHRKALDFSWTAIGFYPSRNFIHCDIRPLLGRQRVEWRG